MESSKEQIEAQLCAYIDGELNDAERAEIERHLASNPQHKALIAELRRHSGLLQDLPRASAPLELNEALCGQLERSALLNPSAQESSHSSLSINRWPQITAVAAVLMLAIGLGIVVYYVLPPSGPSTKGPLAVDSHALQPMTDGAALGKDEKSAKLLAKPDSSELRGMDLASKKGSADKAAQTAPEFDPTAARALEIKNGRLITAREVDELRRRTNMSLHGGNDAFNLDNSSLCLVVSTSNTAAANSQVEEYFKDNRILYMNYDESAARDGTTASDIRLQAAPERAKENDRGRSFAGETSGRRASSAFGTAGRGGAGGGGGRAAHDLDAGGVPAGLSAGAKEQQPAQQEAEVKAQAGAGQTPAIEMGTEAHGPAPVPAPPGVVAGAQPSKSGAFGGGGLGARESARPENEALKQDRNEAGSDRKLPATALSDAQAHRPDSDPALSEQTARKTELSESAQTWEMKDRSMRARLAGKIADDAATSNGVIIARMNRRQANELSAYLSREQGQRAELTTVNLSDASSNAVADAGAKPLAAKDSLGINYARGSVAATAPALKNSVDAIAAIEPAAAANNPKAAPPARYDEKEKALEPAAQLNYGLAAKPAEPLAKRYGELKPASQPDSAESRVLHLGYDPLDEPVDVFIVVKNDALPTAPEIQSAAPKAKAESAPAGDKK